MDEAAIPTQSAGERDGDGVVYHELPATWGEAVAAFPQSSSSQNEEQFFLILRAADGVLRRVRFRELENQGDPPVWDLLEVIKRV